jgi:predicted DNA-binding transcriptional regulator YafY
MTSAQCAEALALSPTVSVAELAVRFNVHPRTVQRVLRNSTLPAAPSDSCRDQQ